VRGKIVSPGFIDAQAHDDRALLSKPDMTPKVSQVVTSLVAGNCGMSLAPLVLDGVPPPPLDLLGSETGWYSFPQFGDVIAALRDTPPAVNYGLFVGHITLRYGVIDEWQARHLSLNHGKFQVAKGGPNDQAQRMQEPAFPVG
jgi:N-acyl-D-amino-acid deacylase